MFDWWGYRRLSPSASFYSSKFSLKTMDCFSKESTIFLKKEKSDP